MVFTKNSSYFQRTLSNFTMKSWNCGKSRITQNLVMAISIRLKLRHNTLRISPSSLVLFKSVWMVLNLAHRINNPSILFVFHWTAVPHFSFPSEGKHFLFRMLTTSNHAEKLYAVAIVPSISTANMQLIVSSLATAIARLSQFILTIEAIEIQ